MFGIGTQEIIFIVLIVLLLFGGRVLFLGHCSVHYKREHCSAVEMRRFSSSSFSISGA